MTINDKRIATFQAIEYNEKTGNFTATIDSSSYNNLVETINYIKLSSLKMITQLVGRMTKLQHLKSHLIMVRQKQ